MSWEIEDLEMDYRRWLEEARQRGDVFDAARFARIVARFEIEREWLRQERIIMAE